MNKYKIAIGPSSFGQASTAAFDMLKTAGCEVKVNPYGRKLTEAEAIDLISDVDGLIAGLEPLNCRVISSAPGLRAIARVGVGVDNIDFDAAREYKVKVSNTPEGPTGAVAEMTVAAMLCLCRELIMSNDEIHKKKWTKTMGTGLKDTKILLIGYGRIGHRVSELLQPFGADVMIFDPLINNYNKELIGRRVDMEEGLDEAQIISLHASGKHVILGTDEFSRMKKGTILLNSARGGLIDEGVLIEALKAGIISKVWMDVFWEEPYMGVLTEFKQALLTPHISTYTSQCRNSMEMDAVKNLLRDLEIVI